MADNQVVAENQNSEVTTGRRRRAVVQQSYDVALGASCMFWGMVIGLGSFILIIIIWVLQHL